MGLGTGSSCRQTCVNHRSNQGNSARFNIHGSPTPQAGDPVVCVKINVQPFRPVIHCHRGTWRQYPNWTGKRTKIKPGHGCSDKMLKTRSSAFLFKRHRCGDTSFIVSAGGKRQNRNTHHSHPIKPSCLSGKEPGICGHPTPDRASAIEKLHSFAQSRENLNQKDHQYAHHCRRCPGSGQTA